MTTDFNLHVLPCSSWIWSVMMCLLHCIIKYKPRYKCIHPTYHGSEVYSMIHPKVKQPRTQRVYDSAVTNTNVCRSMNEETIITTAIVQKLWSSLIQVHNVVRFKRLSYTDSKTLTGLTLNSSSQCCKIPASH